MTDHPDAGSSEHVYVTFRSEGQQYALPASEIAEVIRMTSLAAVPQAPPSLLGLANLRGTVLPVASLRGLLGRSEIAFTALSRLVVMKGFAPIALAVDEVTALVDVPKKKIKIEAVELSSEAGERLRGIFDIGKNTTKILDVEALLNGAFEQSKVKLNAPSVVRAVAETAAVPEERRRLLTFIVYDQEYALDLDAVDEIVLLPGSLTRMPRSEEAIKGVMPYRDTLLPLLSLRKLLNLPVGSSERQKVLVVSVGGSPIGLIADNTRSIVAAQRDRIEAAPNVLSARAGGEAQIKEIYRAGNGRLVAILTPAILFREEVMQKLVRSDNSASKNAANEKNQEARRRFLAFKLNASEFALPIEAIEEVAQVPDSITKLPKTPKFLEGVVNLRGEVLPVVDQRRRFDMPEMKDGKAARRLVVVRSEQLRAGIIVDSVTEVLSCVSDAIKDAPNLTGEALGLVRSVINLDHADRMLLLLDPAELLSRAERSMLDSFHKTIKEFRPPQ
jgi:purine-binding chemotaxis protein CheW